MSWSSYVDYLTGSGVVPQAAIFGALDGAIWAKSPELDVSGAVMGSLLLGGNRYYPLAIAIYHQLLMNSFSF